MNNQLATATKECYEYIEFQDFIIYYNNEESAKQTLKEVFGNQHYQFNANKRDPFIIDAGSNIGIATLFFKMHYPLARIICFEPDPNTFALLKLNVEANQLKDITLVNAALSSVEGLTDFYGQIYVESPDARGNSIIDTWGIQRAAYNKIKVESVRLSTYVNFDVDFLKLDIEGAEEQVLSELSTKIKFIKAMSIEFHEAKQMQCINSLSRVKELLGRYNFDYELIVNDISILPEAVREWANREKPHLYTIKASKKS